MRRVAHIYGESMQHYENVTVGSNPVRVLRKNIEKSLPARQPQEMSPEGRVRLSYPGGFQQALVLREEVARAASRSTFGCELHATSLRPASAWQARLPHSC